MSLPLARSSRGRHDMGFDSGGIGTMLTEPVGGQHCLLCFLSSFPLSLSKNGNNSRFPMYATKTSFETKHIVPKLYNHPRQSRPNHFLLALQSTSLVQLW